MKTLYQICIVITTVGGDVPYYNATITSREYINELKKLSFRYPFYFCSEKSMKVECNESLTEFVTDSGICYTYNIIDSSGMACKLKFKNKQFSLTPFQFSDKDLLHRKTKFTGNKNRSLISFNSMYVMVSVCKLVFNFINRKLQITIESVKRLNQH